ncbi:MAG: hypothetical protein U1F77_03065 [Kiritimatiellia bacterium]
MHDFPWFCGYFCPFGGGFHGKNRIRSNARHAQNVQNVPHIPAAFSHAANNGLTKLAELAPHVGGAREVPAVPNNNQPNQSPRRLKKMLWIIPGSGGGLHGGRAQDIKFKGDVRVRDEYIDEEKKQGHPQPAAPARRGGEKPS